MKFKKRTIKQLARYICGGKPDDYEKYFLYRSSGYLTEFFQDCDTDYKHDGSNRVDWVSSTLDAILSEPHHDAKTPPDSFLRVIRVLMDQEDASGEERHRPEALKKLEATLAREGFEPFYAEDRQCYLRHIGTNTVVTAQLSPHRPFSAAEESRRKQLDSYLNVCSEDELIEEILLPLFRQLGFHRITAAGHKDKALEYGKDVWMKYTLPTQHVLYFGIQAKKGKIDSSGVSVSNVSEIYNQVLMMLGHEIFDPEQNRRSLVDHAFIVAGGEITKQARNWLGGKLDAGKRSQIMFMDREDILNLYVVTSLPLPAGALPSEPIQKIDFDIPF
jgi:hypothetical protein